MTRQSEICFDESCKVRASYGKGKKGCFSASARAHVTSMMAGCSSSAQTAAAGSAAPAADSAAAPAATAAASAAGAEDKVIRVGVICAMTGGSAIYGEGAQNAVDMAVEEINASDSEYKIEIVNGGKIADDAKDANYDLCLDTAALGLDNCVEIIKKVVELKFGVKAPK